MKRRYPLDRPLVLAPPLHEIDTNKVLEDFIAKMPHPRPIVLRIDRIADGNPGLPQVLMYKTVEDAVAKVDADCEVYRKAGEWLDVWVGESIAPHHVLPMTGLTAAGVVGWHYTLHHIYESDLAQTRKHFDTLAKMVIPMK